MAILADAGAVILLLSLRGQDREKECQILDRTGDKTADRVTKAAQSAMAYLTIRAPAEANDKRASCGAASAP